MRRAHTDENTKFLPAPATKVGFAKFKLIDANRTEHGDRKRQRQVEVLVWYPAGSLIDSQRKPYLSDHEVFDLRLLMLRFGHRIVRQVVRSLRTNSFEHAPVSEARDRFPVLIFSHDIGMMPEYYTALMEHLASEGYFVFAINHANISEACIIDHQSDGSKTARTNPLTWLRWKWTLSLAKRRLSGKSYNEKWSQSPDILARCRSFRALHRQMVADQTCLINFLEASNSMISYREYPYNLFSRRLNLSSLGVIGHGWGGAAAVDALVSDARVKAAVNLDGLQFTTSVNQMIRKPLFMIYSQEHSGINEGFYFNSSDMDFHTVEGAKPSSFTDWPFIAEGADTHVLYDTANLVVHFFDKYLKKLDYRTFIKAGRG